MKYSHSWWAWLLCALLLAGCGAVAGEPSPTVPPPGTLAPVAGPQPSAVVPAATTAPLSANPFQVDPSSTVAERRSPGWTMYHSLNHVYDLAFAPDGTLWAATSGGLVQWVLDPASYLRYPLRATDLAVAPDGTVWLNTQWGLCHFDGAQCTVHAGDGAGPQTPILALAVTDQGTVWVATGQGASRFDGQAWKNYPLPVPVFDLAPAAGEEVWAATPDGVAHYLSQEDAWLVYGTEQGLPASQAEVVAARPGGEAWAAFAWEGLYRFDGERWQPTGEPPGGAVAAIAFSPSGTPWVGTVGGTHYPGGSLSYGSTDGWVDVTEEEGLISIRSVALGPGDIVAASTSQGLALYEEDAWHLLRDGPAAQRVTSVAVTPDGATWFAFGDHSVATPGRGVSRLDADGQTWRYFLDGQEVTALAVAPDGALWVGTGCELQRWDGRAWRLMGRCGDDFPQGNILELAFTADGVAWLANGLGLARFTGNEWTTYELLANSVLVAPDGRIWINGWEGVQDSNYVARLGGNEWTTYRVSDSFPGSFRAEAVTADGRLWGIVPGRGLAAFDGRSWSDGASWRFYAPADDLDVMMVLGRAPDGTLWLRTGPGVARLDATRLQDGDAAAAWTTYALEDGGMEVGPSAVAFGAEGTIWFGATRFETQR
ncbi:MAG: hypothetical protein PVI09_06835 [Anaerolineae bacterium]